MDLKQPWDGRDLTNTAPKTLQRMVLDPKWFEHKYCKKHSSIDFVSEANCCHTNVIHEDQHKALAVKVPVVLAEPQIEINLESFVKLAEPALEIKRIRKNVELTQCEIVPSFFRKNKPVFKIFLTGFVRKNIEYATADFGNPKKINGDIRHTTVKVPFSCITELQLEKEVFPCLQYQEPNPIAELEFLDPCHKLSRDQHEFGNINAELLNEKLFCELVKTSVIELDIILDGCQFKKGGQTDKIFRTFKEKMVVLITLKVLQNQQVSISKDKEKKKDKEKDKKKKDKCKCKCECKCKHKHKEKDKDKDKDKKKKHKKNKDKHKCKDTNRDVEEEKDKEREQDQEKHKEKDNERDKPKIKFDLKQFINKSIEETE